MNQDSGGVTWHGVWSGNMVRKNWVRPNWMIGIALVIAPGSHAIAVLPTNANPVARPDAHSDQIHTIAQVPGINVLDAQVQNLASGFDDTHANQASPPGMEQVTSVSQLMDVQPNSWAFQALQSLVERYGVIAGYPDRLYRGDRALSRYEFAAGLNAALDRITERIATEMADPIRQTDLELVERLQVEFAAELATLGGQVEALEARITTVKNQQFAPTVKLRAFSVWIGSDTFGDRANQTRANDTADETQAFLSHYTRLNVVSSFTGKDILTTSLTATNVPQLAFSTGTPMTSLITDPALTLGASALFLERLHYQFPLGDRTMVWIGLRALQPYDFFPTLNPGIISLDGPTSRFSWYNPAVYRAGFDGVGAGIAYKITSALQFHGTYLAAGGFAPDPEVGFGNANNTVVAQLTYTPTPQLTTAFTYAHKYFRRGTANLFGSTGSFFALQPFGLNPTTSDNFGWGFNWRVVGGLRLGGWFGYTQASQAGTQDTDATMLNGSLNLTMLDLFQRGNRGGLIIGVPPRVIRNDYRVGGVQREDPATALHLEVFYTHRLNDNISLTPNLYVILNPNHNADNEPIWVGVIRTNFTF